MNARLGLKAARERLRAAGLEPTDHRVQVLRAVGNTIHPSSAPEVLRAVQFKKDINRVTVYRILDLLVEHGLLNRLGLGERSQRFCLRGIDTPEDHAHFHCTRCDSYMCLDCPVLPVDARVLADLAVNHVDVRLEGICPACQRAQQEQR